jgi:hypothetical protein
MEITIFFVFLIAFIILAIVISAFWKKSTLEHLPPIDGEETLFEEYKIRAEARFNIGRGTVYINSMIRLTHFRIIIAQKMLFQNRYVFRYIIYRKDDKTEDQPGLSALSQTIKSGYVSFPITKADLLPHSEGTSQFITITPKNSGSFMSGIPKELKIKLQRISEFMAALDV